MGGIIMVKTEKIDISNERQKELKSEISKYQEIYDIKEQRSRSLYVRKNKELKLLERDFLSKIYKNIPILPSKHSDLRNVSFKYNDKEEHICTFDISDWDGIDVRLRFSESNDNNVNIIKLNYLTIISSRLSILKSEFCENWEKIKNKYHNYIKSINVFDTKNHLNKLKSELDEILDILRLEEGMVYIFGETVRVSYSKSPSLRDVKSIKILKVNRVNCDLELKTSSIAPIRTKTKKSEILSIIKNNKHTFEGQILRRKKLEKLLDC